MGYGTNSYGGYDDERQDRFHEQEMARIKGKAEAEKIRAQGEVASAEAQRIEAEAKKISAEAEKLNAEARVLEMKVRLMELERSRTMPAAAMDRHDDYDDRRGRARHGD